MTFQFKRTRVVVLALLLASLALLPMRPAPAHAVDTHAPAIAATRAAADLSCPSGGFGPYWWGAVQATQKAFHRKVLDIQGPWFGDGVEVHIWDWLNWSNQYWCLRYAYTAGDGHNVYELVNVYTAECLTAEGSGDGARVAQWACADLNPERQQWKQLPMGWVSNFGTTYSFVNPVSGRCLDVRDFGSANGTPLQIWDCSGGLNQRWF
jgi:ricin-type beta-trefoil lectin protein